MHWPATDSSRLAVTDEEASNCLSPRRSFGILTPVIAISGYPDRPRDVTR